jgi:SAM-dependent methyltransferase
MPAMRRAIRRLLVLGAAGAALAVLVRRSAGPGPAAGELIEGAPVYDRLAGWFLGGFYAGVADDLAATAAPGAHVLDIGCGPGHLLERLAHRGLVVTGIDLDPAMAERAAARLGGRAEVRVADVAALPFPDGTFDLVVSTLSLHHWAAPPAGLAELARVLRPGGRAVIWDLAGFAPVHGDAAGPGAHLDGSVLEMVADTPWRWPWPFSVARRVEARRPA